MNGIGFERRDKAGKKIWRNSIGERVIYDGETNTVEFKDETGRCFPITKELLEKVISEVLI